MVQCEDGYISKSKKTLLWSPDFAILEVDTSQRRCGGLSVPSKKHEFLPRPIIQMADEFKTNVDMTSRFVIPCFMGLMKIRNKTQFWMIWFDESSCLLPVCCPEHFKM